MTTDRPVQASTDTRFATPSAPRDAALRGASLAFGNPPVKPKPNNNTYSGRNGALAAATKVGGGSRQYERHPVDSTPEGEAVESRWGYQSTEGSVRSSVLMGGSGGNASRPRTNRLDSTGFLQRPGATEQNRSPSFIAATIAASRSASISPNPTGQQMSAADSRRQAGFARSPSSRRSSSRDSADRVPDTTSIPPTTSLIGMFEQNARYLDKDRQSTRRMPTVASQPPKPVQRQDLPKRARTPSQSSARNLAESQLTLEPKSRLRARSTSLTKSLRPEVKAKPIPTHTTGSSQKTIHPVSTRSPRKPPIVASKPIAIPNATKQKPVHTNESSSSNETFVSASDYKPSPSFRAALNQNRHLSSTSAASANSAQTIDSMANAIVASSLASSRAASPSKQLSLQPPPAPPSRRSPRSHSHLFHSTKEVSRTPSPSKQSTLRTTMRKPKVEEDVDEGDKRRSRKHIMKKHPNKHHEGDRKRWRDEITERERKRYEAVWASNRGIYIPSSLPGFESSVSNLVVRDIFSRSRLHDDVLEEVYALVDRSQNGVLEKEEFVVGLWLIDQRLKGRKLPLRVSDHVWRSVGSLNGIKVRKAGR